MSRTRSDAEPAGTEVVARWQARVGGLKPVGDVLFAAANLRTGERVLDVGCGTGVTTHWAARDVGPSGRVVGLDISADMLAAAAAEPAHDDAAPVEWVTADAVTWPPTPGVFDVVLSRFGVMFFSDPTAAFTRLATATRSGGRLAMTVWARRDDSDLFAVPLRAALEALRRNGNAVSPPAGDDGPFSLHDPTAVTALLTGAGWAGVACMPHRLPLPIAGTDPAAAAHSILDSGPIRHVTAELDAAGRAAVAAAITDAFADHVDAEGQVRLDARFLVVTATRS